MAPVATEPNGAVNGSAAVNLKALKNPEVIAHPFYSPLPQDDGDKEYEFSNYKPHWPKVDWEPLKEFDFVDRGSFVSSADGFKNLFGAATKVTHLTPAIGTEILGVDLRKLTDVQKDELALLAAERGAVFFRDQPIDIHEQLELGRHFGPLHKHATTGVPIEPGLEEVHLVYNDGSRRPDPTQFAKADLWHSDVSYEIQPPSTTSLKGITIPESGGDTLFSSGYALYSSLSPGLQKYLESLSAVHSAVAQAQGARAGGTHVRRKEIETVHPIVRVHPVTGWKSIFVNPGFTRRIVGIPKAESDAILRFLFSQIGLDPGFYVRFRWEKNSIAIWDNRVVTHSAIFDYWPAKRHALRVTPHGERPLSVAEYEQKTGKQAKDRQIEVWRRLGVDVDKLTLQDKGTGAVKGYND